MDAPVGSTHRDRIPGGAGDPGRGAIVTEELTQRLEVEIGSDDGCLRGIVESTFEDGDEQAPNVVAGAFAARKVVKHGNGPSHYPLEFSIRFISPALITDGTCL
jgi:hypothetical protein